MSHLTIILLIVGAFALIFGTVKAAKAYLENRIEETALFRRYYLPEHDRDFLRESSWCDSENPNVRRFRIDAFTGSDLDVTEQYSNASEKSWRNSDRD